jgi:hypothetical protein
MSKDGVAFLSLATAALLLLAGWAGHVLLRVW